MNKLRLSIHKNPSVHQPPAVATMAVGLTMLALFCLNGCKPRTHQQDTSEYPSTIEKLAVRRQRLDPLAASQLRGRQVYQHYCQICHGADAQGDGFNAAMLDPPPRNFTDETFWKQADDKRLQAVIAKGGKAVGKSVLMPAWGGTLDQQQISDVIAYLRSVPKQAAQAAATVEN